jgi:hypothetical protein
VKPRIWLEFVNFLNLATLLLADSPPRSQYDCSEVTDSFLELAGSNSSAYHNPDIKYFTDSSGFARDDMGFAGYVVVTLDSVTEPTCCRLELLHKRLNSSLSHRHSSSLQE